MGATQWGGAYASYKHFVERRMKLPFAWQAITPSKNIPIGKFSRADHGVASNTDAG